MPGGMQHSMVSSTTAIAEKRVKASQQRVGFCVRMSESALCSCVCFCFAGISNCEFHSGKAEAVLPELLSSWEDARPLVAVVNPSRAGIRKDIPFIFTLKRQF